MASDTVSEGALFDWSPPSVSFRFAVLQQAEVRHLDAVALGGSCADHTHYSATMKINNNNNVDTYVVLDTEQTALVFAIRTLIRKSTVIVRAR